MDHLWSPWRMKYLVGDKPAHCVLCAVQNEPDPDVSLVVHRGEHAYIVLNLYPYNNGHAMVVPKRHVSTIEELDDAELLELMQLVNLVLAGQRRLYTPGGFNVGINLGTAAGAGIAGHVHVHVVPRWAGDTNFMPVLAETRVIPEMLPNTRERLEAAITAVLDGARDGGERVS